MLTHHTYFNLDAYKNPATGLIWDHTLHLPYGKRYLAADGGALPTGAIATAAAGSANDFASKPGIPLGRGRSLSGFKSNCGSGCEGYNAFWVFDTSPPPPRDAALLTLASPWSGVRADLRTNQPGVVLYSCAWSDGKADLKRTQGAAGRKKVEKSSCIAIEPQDYVDGINQCVAAPDLSCLPAYSPDRPIRETLTPRLLRSPEWGRVDAQITGPGETYVWESSWTFGTL